MANPPPPYDNITGISRAVMKDNSQVTLANYNGNARPGELVVNLETNPPALYVGNNVGQLTLITGGGGGGGLPLANGDSYFDIAVASGNVEIGVDDSWFWIFDTAGNLNIPNNIISSSTLRLDNTATGGSADIQLLPADDILLQGRDRDIDSTATEGGDINIYGGDGRPGSGGDDSGSGGDIQIYGGIGGAAGDFDSAGAGGFINIAAGEGGTASAVDNRNAGSGGTLFLTAGNAGDSNGDDTLGSGGGGITITAGNSTGNGVIGGGVAIYAGSGGPNASAGEVEINIPSSDAGPGGTWNFDYAGNFTLPLGGNIVGVALGNNGHLNWIGSSSGDGNGYTTMTLVPDDTLTGSDQYLIIDPTAPGHIHIRAGGTQDNSGADLFLGGENSYFKVGAGSNSQTTISSNSNTWTFGTDGSLAVPGPISLAVYANATVRDAAITSPTPGMMIYVTGTGMQVRGATSWNTIAGSGT